MDNEIFVQPYDSPCGRMLLGSYADKLCLCDWENGLHRSATEARIKRMLKANFVYHSTETIDAARQQLDEYFRCERQTFSIPLLCVGSEFQKTVWTALLAIPFGKTVSYADVARHIGMPTAVRAVANANGANAISIIVPCHRVIGSNGALTGYGGGVSVKEFLLNLESCPKTTPPRFH